MKQQTICVDLAGVLAEYSGWEGIETIGQPLEGSREFLLSLHKLGYKVSIFTTRTNPEINYPTPQKALVNIVEKWLTENDMYFDEVYSGIGKPLCSHFVDDRAIYCPASLAKEAFDMVISELQQELYNLEIIKTHVLPPGESDE